MVVMSFDPGILELDRGVFALLLGEAVHDTSLALVLVLRDELDDLLDDRLCLGANLVVEIRSIERRREEDRVLHAQIGDDIGLDATRGGGGESHEWNVGVVLLETRHCFVVGTCKP